MKKTLVAITLIVISVAQFGCKKKDDTPSNNAQVKFVNGCAGTTGIDAKISNVIVPGAANVTFLSGSGYQNVTAGATNIAYFLTNVGTPASNGSVTLTANTHYTAYCGGIITGPTFLLTEDDLAAPTSGSSAKIRFVNLSPDALNVTATAGTTTIGAGVTALHGTGFIQLQAGSYDLKAGDPTNIASVVNTGAQQLSAGKIYTLMLTGTGTGTGQSALKVTLLTNN